MPIWELENMPGSVLQEAMNYYDLEPFGAERDNLHAAMMTAAVINVHTPKEKAPVKLDSFMIRPVKQNKTDDKKSFFEFLATHAVPKDADKST
jgi:hypothetical protein